MTMAVFVELEGTCALHFSSIPDGFSCRNVGVDRVSANKQNNAQLSHFCRRYLPGHYSQRTNDTVPTATVAP